MPEKNIWENNFQKSQEEFSASHEAKQSTERIYNAIMSRTISPDNDIIPFSTAQQIVADLASQAPVNDLSATIEPQQTLTKKNSQAKRPQAPRKKAIKFPRNIAVLGSIAALFAVLILNLNQAPSPAIMNNVAHDPPLTAEDIPIAMINRDLDCSTIATNDTFFLAQINTTEDQNTVELIVHSREGKIDWNRFFAVDSEDAMVTPLSVNQDKSTIMLPITNLDMDLEVTDDKGNTIRCTIPKSMTLYSQAT